jgi:hypothetical protein
MRRLLSLCLSFLFFIPELNAGTHDWQNLASLKRGDTIRLILRDGSKLEGEFDSFGSTGIRLAVFTGHDVGFGSFREVERGRITKVVRLNHPNLPDPHKLLAGGALIGGATGAIVGAARTPSDRPRESGAVLGGLSGAAIGTLGGAFVGIGIVTHATLHRTTVIYESK